MATEGKEMKRPNPQRPPSSVQSPSPNPPVAAGQAIANWEWIGLAVIIAVGAWFRFSHLDLLEFQGDEAYAANLALGFVKHGRLPAAGLMSSVGVTNPPLFSYLLIPMFAISPNPVFVSCCIAALGLAAVVICWHIGRVYYGPMAGLVAAAMFAVSPWAVIYSRKIWAQDFVPIFATGTMWALHALVLGRRPKAIFWCLFLPLCVIQIHFSGLALTAVVLVVAAWLRPRIDWRFAGAGLIAAILPMLPYLNLQIKTGWTDFKQAMTAVGGNQQWEQLRGMTIHPVTGYRFPSREYASYSLDIMNGGRIEDVLGIGASQDFDANRLWWNKGGKKYFLDQVTLINGLLFVQRLAFLAALVWLGMVAIRAVRRWKVTEDAGQTAWILVLWILVPVLVFWMAGLWVYLSYFAILYPVHFLACGAAAETLGHSLPVAGWPSKRWGLVAGVVLVLLAANVMFMLDFYRFVGLNGGAQGTFGTGLGYKQSATRFLAEQGGAPLRTECRKELELATVRSTEERARLGREIGQPMLLELNHEGQPELPQLEWPFLVTQAGAGLANASGATAVSTNRMMVLVDGNREALPPQEWQQLAQYPGTNFGPIRIYFVKR